MWSWSCWWKKIAGPKPSDWFGISTQYAKALRAVPCFSFSSFFYDSRTAVFPAAYTCTLHVWELQAYKWSREWELQSSLSTTTALGRFPPLDTLPVGARFKKCRGIQYIMEANVPQMCLAFCLQTAHERMKRMVALGNKNKIGNSTSKKKKSGQKQRLTVWNKPEVTRCRWYFMGADSRRAALQDNTITYLLLSMY